MSFVQVVNESRKRLLGGKIRVAHSLVARMRGFMFTRPPAQGEGLFLTSCRGVHTYWMRVPLDVLLVNDAGEVVATYPALPPGTRTAIHRAARYALELPSGAITRTGTAIGDRLSWKPVPSA
ncbi:MAG TPA: DUF192 domain-containing protein [Longimicrobiales bacterium]|nr:DUF192 domain-containing protein [Longimicrobiales bacterium]